MNTATHKQPTCEERIDASLASTMFDLRAMRACDPEAWEYADTQERIEMIDALNDATGSSVSVFASRSDEPPHDCGLFHEYGLSFDYVESGTFDDQDEAYWRFQLSWGGPSTEIRFYASWNGRNGANLYRAEYWYLNWFDGAHRTLYGADLETARDVWEFFSDVGSVEHALIEGTS